MKTLICGLVAAVSVAVVSAIFAEVDDVHHIVTGTIVSVSVTWYIDIDTHDGGTFGAFVDRHGSYKPKVGDNVKLHYYADGRHNVADKIEKVGKTEKGSKKN
jgi:hypothetical protein